MEERGRFVSDEAGIDEGALGELPESDAVVEFEAEFDVEFEVDEVELDDDDDDDVISPPGVDVELVVVVVAISGVQVVVVVDDVLVVVVVVVGLTPVACDAFKFNVAFDAAFEGTANAASADTCCCPSCADAGRLGDAGLECASPSASFLLSDTLFALAATDLAKAVHWREYSETPSSAVRSTMPESHGLFAHDSHMSICRCVCVASGLSSSGATVNSELVVNVFPKGTSRAMVLVLKTTVAGGLKRTRCRCSTEVSSAPQGTEVERWKETLRVRQQRWALQDQGGHCRRE